MYCRDRFAALLGSGNLCDTKTLKVFFALSPPITLLLS